MKKNYEDYFNNRYAPFLNMIRNYIKDGNKFLEAGCGTGLVTKLVKQQNKDFKGIDINTEMLKLSLSRGLGKLEKADIRTFNTTTLYDVTYSHGVLEHLSIEDIKKTINNQMKYSKRILHYVPTSKYSSKSYGDEKLLSIEEWVRIVKPTKTISFNNGYDLILEKNG
jgi:trans-aconitate methyltransferase